MYTLGAEIVPFHDFPLEDSLRALADMGLTHVNLWSSAAPLAHHINPGDDTAAINKLLARYGITPTGLTMYGKTQEEMRQRIHMAAVCQPDAHSLPKTLCLAASSSTWKGCGSYLRANALISSAPKVWEPSVIVSPMRKNSSIGLTRTTRRG